MSVEWMIYIYLFVCLAMIVFNIVTAIVLKRKDKRITRVSEAFEKEVTIQLEKVRRGEPCDESHRDYLCRKLKRIGNMIAFDKTLEAVYNSDRETVKRYLGELDSVCTVLCGYYRRKDRMEEAYFPYIVKKYGLIAFRSMPAVTEAMFALLEEPSIYSRENAMQALYSSGDRECVIRALMKIDKSNLFYHGKLISDGLLNFAGSREDLIAGLTDRFEAFSTPMQVNLLNYMRFASPDCCEFQYSLLRDENRDDEIRYCAIRYLGKYRYEPACDTLRCMAEERREEKWRYAAIAASALAIYPGAETIRILKENLYSGNWYIRFNAARSLEQLGVSYAQLGDVLDGNDRYASEILRYRLQREEGGTVSV